MRVAVYVRPKAGILDPQGEAVRRSLAELDFAVKDVRIGRLVDLDVDAQTAEEARTAAARMCERLLANPLIESYEIEVAPTPQEPAEGRP
ncbi:MAG: phosphoribosylformylglycinamidine synthase subunit PurS [Actinomycetia bacterium]|nr:phosphoribosylformylglycinamidine synthase subunit PurS [Actinomycetes bacterium]